MRLDAVSDPRAAVGSAGAARERAKHTHGLGSAGSAAVSNQVTQTPCIQEMLLRLEGILAVPSP